MPSYPWGNSKTEAKRNIWLRANGLSMAFKEYKNQAISDGMDKDEADIWASDTILEDYEKILAEKGIKVNAPVREDWYWAFKHYGDRDTEDKDEKLTKKDAPSPFAWSLLVGAWKSDTSWKGLQDRVSKDLFGGNDPDGDDRAFIATGMPTALRERFSGVLAEAKRLFAGKLPEVFGRTEGS